MSPRVCILEPMALACVALGGVCLGLLVWGWSIGHAGQMVMAGLIGAVLAFVVWRLGCEDRTILVSRGGTFWRVSIVRDRELTAEGLESGGEP